MPLVPGATPNAGEARRLAIFQKLAAMKAQFAARHPNMPGVPPGQDPRQFMRQRLMALMAQHGQQAPPHPGHGGPWPRPPGSVPPPAPPGGGIPGPTPTMAPGPTPNIGPEATTNAPPPAAMGMAGMSAPPPTAGYQASAKFGGQAPGIPGGAPGPTMDGGGFGGAVGGNNPLMIALMELMRRYQSGQQQQVPGRGPTGFPGG